MLEKNVNTGSYVFYLLVKLLFHCPELAAGVVRPGP